MPGHLLRLPPYGVSLSWVEIMGLFPAKDRSRSPACHLQGEAVREHVLKSPTVKR